MKRESQEKKTKKITVLFWILFALTVLLSAAVFELGKNTLWGWGLLLLFWVLWLVLRGKLLAGRKLWLRMLAFVGAIAVIVGIFRISGPPVRSIPAVTGASPKKTKVVTVAQGQLTGVYNDEGTVEVYAGIPYAKPPVGDLRWKEPQPPESWEGIRACDTFAPMSMQQRTDPIMGSLTDLVAYHRFQIDLNDNYLEPMSEDSLYLNIWKPAGDAQDLPVLVFIHGGALMTGQPSYGDYNGEELAKKGIIVVNFGYRLNIFGYFACEELAEESPNGTTGNYGLLDQIQALRWVQENIGAFGGDPAQVTIAGESAGASSVNALCVSPLSEGLFVRAIAESSGITAKVPYHTFRSYSDALEMGEQIQKEFHAETLEELRSIPAEQLVNTRYANNSMTVDGYAITEQPYRTYEKGNNHETALLQGFNVHEADPFCMGVKVNAETYVEQLRPLYGDWAEAAAELFPPEEQDPAYRYIIDAGGTAKGSYNRLVSAAWFTYSHYNWARLLEARSVPVYTYFFTKDNGSIGTTHAGELPYFYGNLEQYPRLYDDGDRRLSAQMSEYYVNFVKYGDPNGPELPVWLPWSEAPGQVLELGEEVRMIPDPYLAVYEYIDLYQNSLQED